MKEIVHFLKSFFPYAFLILFVEYSGNAISDFFGIYVAYNPAIEIIFLSLASAFYGFLNVSDKRNLIFLIFLIFTICLFCFAFNVFHFYWRTNEFKVERSEWMVLGFIFVVNVVSGLGGFIFRLVLEKYGEKF